MSRVGSALLHRSIWSLRMITVPLISNDVLGLRVTQSLLVILLWYFKAMRETRQWYNSDLLRPTWQRIIIMIDYKYYPWCNLSRFFYGTRSNDLHWTSLWFVETYSLKIIRSKWSQSKPLPRFSFIVFSVLFQLQLVVQLQANVKLAW